MEYWKSPSELLAKFDVNKDAALDFEEFHALCIELFEEEEITRNEYIVRDIFDVFDLNVDGLLNDEEWRRCYEEWIRVTINPVNILLVVDVQNDFIDGTLALRNCSKGDDGAEIIEPINRLIKEGNWEKVIYSLDWHPENHIGFYENLHLRSLHPDSKISKEEAKLFDTVIFLQPKLEQRLWPVHCIINTWGAQLHKDLIIAKDSEQIRKGQNPDMETYSAFFDNNCVNSTELIDKLKKIGATDIYVCGLAYDVCVKATCLDGLRLGYRLAIIEDCCRGVDDDDVKESRREIVDNGGLVTNSDSILQLLNGKKKSLVMARHGAFVLAKKLQK